MLPLRDPQLRLVLLNHIAVRLSAGDPADLHSAGIESEQLARLRELSAIDLSRLAAMRELGMGVALDNGGLKAGLRAISLIKEAQALEAYFIRHGASWRMMATLFKMRHKLTLQRRREVGAWRPPGRPPLPDLITRERIYRAWRAIEVRNPRVRYYQLHQTFPHVPIAVLAAVVGEFEADA
jgi:hypothetical protein